MKPHLDPGLNFCGLSDNSLYQFLATTHKLKFYTVLWHLANNLCKETECWCRSTFCFQVQVRCAGRTSPTLCIHGTHAQPAGSPRSRRGRAPHSRTHLPVHWAGAGLDPAPPPQGPTPSASRPPRPRTPPQRWVAQEGRPAPTERTEPSRTRTLTILPTTPSPTARNPVGPTTPRMATRAPLCTLASTRSQTLTATVPSVIAATRTAPRPWVATPPPCTATRVPRSTPPVKVPRASRRRRTTRTTAPWPSATRTARCPVTRRPWAARWAARRTRCPRTRPTTTPRRRCSTPRAWTCCRRSASRAAGPRPDPRQVRVRHFFLTNACLSLSVSVCLCVFTMCVHVCTFVSLSVWVSACLCVSDVQGRDTVCVCV